MRQLETYFNPNGQDTACQKSFLLFGLGGIGKTQLAVEYARRHYRSYSAVLWLDGSSADQLKQSFVKIAYQVPEGELSCTVTETLQSSTVDTDVVVKGILRWLSLPSNVHWLIVIDNVDRDVKDEDPQAYDVKEYFPEGYHGSIIITSRLASLARNLGDSLKVNKVNSEQAKEMLESNAKKSIEGQFSVYTAFLGLF